MFSLTMFNDNSPCLTINSAPHQKRSMYRGKNRKEVEKWMNWFSVEVVGQFFISTIRWQESDKHPSKMDTVNEFIQTWQKRKEGILPPVDLRVSCSHCGNEIIGDSKIQFTKDGLLCLSCFKGK